MQEQIRHFLLGAVASGRKVPLDLERSALEDKDEIKLADGLHAITKKLKPQNKQHSLNESNAVALPRTITFPYSRHSSFPELCELTDAFKPRDIWPCTVDLRRWIEEDITIEGLFGAQCSDSVFRHDKVILRKRAKLGCADQDMLDTQATTASTESSQRHILEVHSASALDTPQPSPSGSNSDDDVVMDDDIIIREHASFEDFDGIYPHSSQQSITSENALEARINAFQAMLNNARKPGGKRIELISTTDHHTVLDEELGFDQT